jgi:hypothetical protein
MSPSKAAFLAQGLPFWSTAQPGLLVILVTQSVMAVLGYRLLASLSDRFDRVLLNEKVITAAGKGR